MTPEGCSPLSTVDGGCNVDVSVLSEATNASMSSMRIRRHPSVITDVSQPLAR